MGAPLDTQKLGSIFQSRPDILDGIQRAADTPARIALFNEIATHIHDHFQENGEPASKRRKVDSSQHSNGPNGAAVEGPDPVDDEILLEIKEISVSVPQRKKLEMCLTQHYLYARAPGTTAPLPGAVFAWKDIEYIFYLPVPEKAQVQHNYVVIPRGACLPAPKTDTPTTPIEPLVFTVPATPPKAGTIGGREASKASSVSDTYKSLFHWAFDTRLKSAGNKVEIVSGNPQRFHSVIRQAQRPNEKAVHVGAYKGSKDGFLFFLENGIMWGFKKPLLFIPLNRIVAISYTNILQITFNTVVEVLIGDGDATEEVEFSMLDQQDYGGIDGYIKANHLQDGSMAEQRKAKLQLAENKKGSKQEGGENGEGAGTADGDAGNGMTELEKAQGDLEQQLQDDEDEDEEDYDPGSEGDSEGSGSSDDDDDDDDDDDEEEEEDEDDVGEGEEAEGENEEEVKEPIPVKEEAKPPPPAPKAAPKAAPKSRASKAAATPASAPAPVPVRQGFAPMNAAPASNGMDLDEEFDVVG